MASVKYSGLISEMKGVLNGSILSNGYNSKTIRNRHSGGGRKTSAWTASKVQLAYVASQWRNLTPAEQDAWLAMAPSYPYIDKFGDPQIPSGYQLFCTLNINLLLTNNLVDYTPHAPTAESNIGPILFDTNAIGGFEINFTPSASMVSLVLVYASVPLSAGVTVPPRRKRLITKFYDNATSPQTLTSDYNRVFGGFNANSRIWLQAEQIQLDIGQRYATGIGSVII
jgi:hypothetical protein